MSIKKQVIKTKPVVKVTFSIEAKEANTGGITLIGNQFINHMIESIH